MISNNAYVNDITMYMSLVSIYYVDSIDRVNKVLPTSLLNITNFITNVITKHYYNTSTRYHTNHQPTITLTPP